MPSQKMTRYYIPHPHEPGCEIAGDLEQVEPELPTHGRKVALVCLLSILARQRSCCIESFFNQILHGVMG